LRSDMESDTPNQLKQLDGFKRLIAQMKEEIDKQAAEQTLSIQQVTSNLQDLQKTIERVKQEQSANDVSIRTLISEEARARTSQLAVLQDSCNGIKNDVETELKTLKQTMDARVRQRRQGDDELLRRMDEYALSIQQDHKNHEAFEALVKKELAEVKQSQKHERVDVNNIVQAGLQALDNQMNNRLALAEVNLTHEIGQAKSACEGVEKRLSVLFEEMIQLKDRTVPRFDEEVLRTSVERAQRAIENEINARSSSEEVLRQQVDHLSALFESRHGTPLVESRQGTSVPSVASDPNSGVDRHSVPKQVEQPKPQWQDSDLMKQVRSISTNHLQGNLRIWGRKDENSSMVEPAPGSVLSESSATQLEKRASQAEKLAIEADNSSAFTSKVRALSADRFGLATGHTSQRGGYGFRVRHE